MRKAYRRSPATNPAVEFVEIVTPRTNAAGVSAAENLFSAIPLAEPFSLELAATASARWFLARVPSDEMRHFLSAQLAVAYPQARLRPVDVARHRSLDPAVLAPDEQVAACALALRAPVYLPIRTFSDREGDDTAQSDPVLGILGALDDLPDGWRALSQLVLRPAPDNWAAPYVRLALEQPLEAERQARSAQGGTASSDPFVALLAGLLVLGAIGLQGYAWYAAGNWLDLGLVAGGVVALAAAVAWVSKRLGKKTLHDPRLVAEKIGRPAHRAELRLAVFAPSEVSPDRVALRLDRIVAAYRPYSLAHGNGFQPRRLDLTERSLTDLGPFGRVAALPILNSRELAGLWHLPRAGADVPFVERTTARERLPLPATVAQGCRVGVSIHQGREVAVSVPDDVLRRHLLLVAKTRRGKSTLLLRLFRHLAETRTAAGGAPTIVLIDPHRDLARAALGLIPPHRRDDLIALDVARVDRPFGLNLLDVGLGWNRDRAVANALIVFKREFSGAWGFRMEDAFRFALNTLYEVNAALCASSPEGRNRQYTLLQLPALLTDVAFRRTLLPLITDPATRAWWSRYYEPLDRRFQLEVVNPVQTKVQRFAGAEVARNLVGQARSTIDPLGWVRQGKVVVVNTAKGTVGEDTASLIGGTILNLVALAIAAQADRDPTERRPVCLLVDEFQSVPGADFESILSELAKFGANLVLATQSLAQLETLDRLHERALRSVVFANLDGLFAFHCSAEDARYLVRELGEEVDEHDLVSLGEHRCYARLSSGGERLPVFSVCLDPPPNADPALSAEVARESALLYGRDRRVVDDEIRLALERIEALHRVQFDPGQPGEAGKGVPKDGPNPYDGPSKKKQRTRDHRRDEQSRGGQAKQMTLPKSAPDEPEDGPADQLEDTVDEDDREDDALTEGE